RERAAALFEAEDREAAVLRRLARRIGARRFEANGDDLARAVEGVNVENHLPVERQLLIEADIGVLARAAGLAVAAEGVEVVVALLARHAVDVRTTPRIVRHRLLQVRPGPAGLTRGLRHERGKALFRRRVMPRIEAI